MTLNKDIRLLAGLAALLLISACQNSPDDIDIQENRSTVELMTLATPFTDVTSRGTTRTEYEDHLPKGWLSYNILYPHASPAESTIGVFMTPVETTALGNFIYEGIKGGVAVWKSTVTVEDGEQYYIYGFMPREGAETATVDPIDGDYSKGVTLSIQNYTTLTAADVSAVVGIRKATADEKITGPTSDVRLGNFGYVGSDKGENFLFVLLEHLYAGFHFKVRIDPEYHKMRSIKVTQVELIAQNISKKTNLSFKVTANATGDDPLSDITYQPVSTPTERDSVVIFPYEGSVAEFEVPETDPTGFLGCYVPGSCTDFVIRSTYDVYDRKGNLIDRGRQAENKINSDLVSGLTGIGAGEYVTIDLLVKPTYLYVLSDPDLDNPTIELTTATP